ncbi:hypothetical protein E24_00354 [Faustovirus]|nr:hypothetical protein E24_00354 [Faustovirus]AMN84253.1 hypothetical protein D5a_00351 [Faustovirus]AMN85241.1 hypothetical protein E23_00354 [Faustovirus]
MEGVGRGPSGPPFTRGFTSETSKTRVDRQLQGQAERGRRN